MYHKPMHDYDHYTRLIGDADKSPEMSVRPMEFEIELLLTADSEDETLCKVNGYFSQCPIDPWHWFFEDVLVTLSDGSQKPLSQLPNKKVNEERCEYQALEISQQENANTAALPNLKALLLSNWQDGDDAETARILTRLLKPQNPYTRHAVQKWRNNPNSTRFDNHYCLAMREAQIKRNKKNESDTTTNNASNALAIGEQP